MPVDLSGLVKEVVRLAGHPGERGAGSASTPAASAPGSRVLGEPDELARLLTNVVGNAIKYTPDGGDRLDRRAHEDGDAVVACSDTGIGIAEEDLGTLFEEFDRSSNPAAHAVPGTGLGLAIVRRIVDRHGG